MAYKKGFTLIELIVVITIMSLLAASALPIISISERRNIESCALQLKSDIRFIQSMSMATGERFCIELTETSGYTVKNTAQNHTIKTVPLNGIKKLEYNASAKIEYTPTGTINSGRKIVLYTNNYSCTLVVRAVTGKVDKYNIEMINES